MQSARTEKERLETILKYVEGGGTPTPSNRDLSSLVKMLSLLHQKQTKQQQIQILTNSIDETKLFDDVSELMYGVYCLLLILKMWNRTLFNMHTKRTHYRKIGR
jgi:hypothetical protein